MGAAPSRQEASSASSPTAVGRAAVPTMAPSASTTSDAANQAQSKRAPPPHMFREIVAGEKATDVAALEDQASTGILLAGKTKVRLPLNTNCHDIWDIIMSFDCFFNMVCGLNMQRMVQKYWVDGRTRHNCFMLLPRGLHITWSEDPKYWTWQPLKEGSDAQAETESVALQNVCWLEVIGKLELSHLTPGVTYDVVFEVMLTDPAYGWSTPVNLRLKLPDGTMQQHKENLMTKTRGEWQQLKVGEVKPLKGQNGEAEVSMFEYEGGQWKRGLLIKGIKIVPKE
ncbi:hypothetical protein ACQ4PT_041897 [Festuca glaucescens]